MFRAAAEETGVLGLVLVLCLVTLYPGVPFFSLLTFRVRKLGWILYKAPNLHIYQEAGREEREPPQSLTCLEF